MAAGWVDVIRRALGWKSSLTARGDIYYIDAHIHQTRSLQVNIDQAHSLNAFITQKHRTSVER